MSWINSVRGLFAKEKKPDANERYAIVLLLRSPIALSKGLLEEAACRAFGVPYDGSQPMYFVVWDSALTIVKAGGSVIQVLAVAESYLGDPVEVSKGFKHQPLAAAWREHGAWIALDLWNEDMPKKQAYRVLAALAAELLDVRCAGIYLPKENQFTIQEDGSAAEHLRRLRSA